MKTNSTWSVWCLTTIAVLLPCGVRPAGAGETATIDFPIVRDGRPIVEVVVAGDNKILAAAVKDFQDYVRRITGAELKVTSGTGDLLGPTLHIGATDLFRKIEPDLGVAVKGDGFAIAPIGEDLLIAGTLPEGTANGLMTILQDQFGVRWYYPGELWEIVPQARSLAVRAKTGSEKPLDVQSPSFYGRFPSGDWAAQAFGRRMRLTQKGVPLPYVGSGHALSAVVPAKRYGQEHPDYFPLIGGRRVVEDGVNPCFTHPDMPEVFMQYIREGGRGFGVEDNLSHCECERCRAVDGGSQPYNGMPNVSESFFQLIAKVAARTEKEFPGQRIGMFAYQLTNAPPRTVEHVGKNVSIVLCQDTAQYFDPEYRRIDQEMSAEWCRKAGSVSFYDYVGIDYWTPRYFPSILADQLRHIVDAGVLGYFTHTPTMPDSSMPMFYVLCRMLWDAHLDADALIETMLADLYGEAAGPVRAFYRHWEECWKQQKKSKWFYGMDDFRAEMTIYTLADIERGARLLDEAAAAARDEKVRKRVAFLQDYFAFTHAAARTHEVSMRAIRSNPASPDEAKALSNAVVDVWRDFARQLEHAEKLPGSSISGWHPRCTRVRIWALKQQVRDAVAAPLVRWICANEGGGPSPATPDPGALRAIEREFADLAVAGRRTVDSLVTENISAAPRLARVNTLRPADVPRVAAPPSLSAAQADWGGIPQVDALPWIFRARPDDSKLGRYDDPVPEHVIDPPAPADQSMAWQCAWDEQALYIRVAVRDDRHVQEQPPETMWRQDSLQIAVNPKRNHFEIPGSSWDYLMGGYHGEEIELNVSLRGTETQAHLSRTPPSLAAASGSSPRSTSPRSLVTAKAARHGDRTIYDVAVDWKLVRGFEPAAERSLGLSLVVNDVDSGERRSAEYGSGVISRKRPTEFAAVRLIAP